jgi:hypothetical protein
MIHERAKTQSVPKLESKSSARRFSGQGGDMTLKTDPATPSLVRPYRVHARDDGRRLAVVVEESSAEAAAVAYAESCPAADAEISLIVRDLTDGREQCICVDLESGVASDCAGA